jgi:hypothetical protein
MLVLLDIVRPPPAAIDPPLPGLRDFLDGLAVRSQMNGRGRRLGVGAGGRAEGRAGGSKQLTAPHRSLSAQKPDRFLNRIAARDPPVRQLFEICASRLLRFS